MIRSIIVPIDGSDFSTQAVPHAVAIARSSGATVTLVQVHVPVYPTMSMESIAAVDLQMEREVEEQEELYLAALAAKAAKESAFAVSHKLVHGDVVPTLVEYARITHAHLVVMTTHGRGGLSRAWIGSVADELIRAINIPVLLSRPKPGVSWNGTAHTFDHILVPLDGSALAESILPFALDLGGMHALYTLLRVREPADVLGFGYYAAAVLSDRDSEDAAIGRALSYLDDVASPLRERAVRVHTTVRSGTSPSFDILDYAKQYEVDLIALSTHGRRGLSRVALGSVADKVLRNFDGSVLVYRPVKPLPEVRDAWAGSRANAANEEGRNAGIS
jgi:nucleotide-binding universal stress UspA family protein